VGVFGEAPKTVAAWVASVNAQGGLDCHTLKYIIADDGGDPSRNQALTQKLVEQDHVVAFVDYNAPLSGYASVQYNTQKGVPVIGDSFSSPWFYESPMYFPQASAAGDQAGFAAAGAQGKATGKTKLAVLACVEALICSRAHDAAPESAPRFGMTLVYRAKVSMAQPDYTSNCQAAQSAGAQVLFVGLEINSIKRIARSCRAVNYDPIYASCGICILDPTVAASDPLLDGLMLGNLTAPWTAMNHPGVVEYISTLKRYAPGLRPGAIGMSGWVSAQLFQRAARNLSDPPTSQDILNGLWSIKNEDLGGLTVPLSFTKGQNSPNVFCYWLVQLKGGQYASPNEAQRTCV
jgi:branched-chain amino acid transport system substrate-binding protein